jgi:uncharacterized protein
MAVDHIRYDLVIQDALRGAVRNVLIDAAKNGLPGSHHFLITFDTRADNVRMSPRLKAQYPKEMTIVLQHQFWDLRVTDEAFEAGLSFGGVAERLTVPFAAIKGFADPSVEFGLQFESTEDSDAEADATPAEPKKRPELDQDVAAGRPLAAMPTPLPANPDLTPPAGEKEPNKPSGSGEVVRLDRFRKK